MYRILIADDEALEREGLEMMVSRMMGGTFQFIHAENGRKAIQLAEEHRPDIIFMDINMPGIQGLEAIKEILSRHPQTKMILVTAYDYFAYAKEAVALGVKDYILKPAKKEEIVATLQKMVLELDQEKRKRGEELELKEKLSRLLPVVESEFAIMLMLDYVREMDLQQLIHMLDYKWDTGYSMVLSFHQEEKRAGEAFYLRKRNVYEAVKSYIKPQLPCIVSPMIGSQIALFIPCGQNRLNYSHRVESLEWGRRLRQWVEGQFTISIAVGIGAIHEGMEGLRRSYHEAVMVSSDPSAIVTVRHYDDILQVTKQESFTLDDEKQLMDALYRLDQEEAVQKFAVMFEKLERSTGGNMEACRNEIIALFLSISRKLSQAGVNGENVAYFKEVHHPDHLRQMAQYRLQHMISEIKDEREKRNVHMIDRAISFIHEKHKEDISMEQVAEYVNLSPYYFSKMFKMQVGETFIDYLTGLRINQAKELIHQQEYSLKEICFEIGYKDPNYFSRVFKKVTGVTPTEYRQQVSS